MNVYKLTNLQQIGLPNIRLLKHLTQYHFHWWWLLLARNITVLCYHVCHKCKVQLSHKSTVCIWWFSIRKLIFCCFFVSFTFYFKFCCVFLFLIVLLILVFLGVLYCLFVIVCLLFAYVCLLVISSHHSFSDSDFQLNTVPKQRQKFQRHMKLYMFWKVYTDWLMRWLRRQYCVCIWYRHLFLYVYLHCHILRLRFCCIDKQIWDIKYY